VFNDFLLGNAKGLDLDNLLALGRAWASSPLRNPCLEVLPATRAFAVALAEVIAFVGDQLPESSLDRHEA
jgi:hypothetical protein